MRTITHWPKSVPDYKWPSDYASHGMAPIRWLMAGVFHAAYAVGRCVSDALARVQQYTERPTLVIRTDGIGDALLFEPALESLARRLSPSEVHLWAPKATCELFRECPTITRRLPIPRGGKDGNLRYFKSLWLRAKLGFEMGRWNFETVVYPVQSPEPFGNWLFTSARADERWITAGDLDNQFDWQQDATLEEATRVLESRPGESAHELSRNEYLSDQWAEEGRLRRPRVHLSSAAAMRADALASAWRRAADRLGAGDLVGVVVGSASKTKHYPAQQWADTIAKMWEEHRAIVVLLGGKDDQREIEELAALLTDVPHLRLTRPVDLLVLSAIVRRLDGMLAVDTGLAHISLSMRIPTVVLVTGGHPGRFFPWPGAKHHVVLNVAMPCEGCKNRCHLPEASCITKVTPHDIVQAYSKLRIKETAIEPFVVPAAATQERATKKKAAG